MDAADEMKEVEALIAIGGEGGRMFEVSMMGFLVCNSAMVLVYEVIWCRDSVGRRYRRP